jgi:uncharacterized membrane protein YhaH (DUF805 family)
VSTGVFLGIAALCGLYGFIEAGHRGQQEERPTTVDLNYLFVLVIHSVFVFVILIVALSSLHDSHWTRCGIIVLLLLVPMVLEVIYEVHMPLFGILRDSEMPLISRSAAYYVGGIVFVIAFRPLPIESRP